ncbi:hypothetical protein GLOIN_2v1784920 [Rhizophagus clarus]|uniref:Uncharacterized protein n=1 Tax=Rhizophagus clarus TaxID=94130 RepID=A0A8H3LRN8_9GLOM|nr:hypothetical protein GLOIN_2v1784920 [Rhizophagus clarus]
MDEIEVETQNNTTASETKIDISNKHEEEIPSAETKDDTFENHRKSIRRIFVSQYMGDTSTYNEDIFTYSEKDKSVLGWSGNIEKDGPKQPDVYFKIDKIGGIDGIEYLKLDHPVLSKKILLLCKDYDSWLIDLNRDRTNSDRFLELKRPISRDDYAKHLGRDSIGFLPNGDLIQVSLSDRKIYKYCLKDKNIVPWMVNKLIDPYQVYDEIDISDDFNETSAITKLNRKIFIDNDSVCVTNGLDENKLKQLSNKIIYNNSIYNSSTFKIIQNMLNEIIDQVDIKKVLPSYTDRITRIWY